MRRPATTSSLGVSRRSLLTWAGIGLGAAVTGCRFDASDDASAADDLSAADWSALQSKLHGKLVLPGQSEYGQARLPFNPLFDTNMPAGVAQVADAADVQQCIAFARSEGLHIAARSGGQTSGRSCHRRSRSSRSGSSTTRDGRIRSRTRMLERRQSPDTHGATITTS